MNTRVRRVAWRKDEPFGAEHAEVRFRADSLQATGVAIGGGPMPFRLDYELETTAQLVTARLELTAKGDGWVRALTLHRVGSGRWDERVRDEGGPPPRQRTELAALADALDVDLGLSPLFNTMPVLRHGLLRGGRHDFVMAWVSVPDLSVRRSPQRYSFVRDDGDRSVVRFESLAGDGFSEEIVYDRDGLVVAYPRIASRLSVG